MNICMRASPPQSQVRESDIVLSGRLKLRTLVQGRVNHEVHTVDSNAGLLEVESA